jgi:hypothetical protein
MLFPRELVSSGVSAGVGSHPVAIGRAIFYCPSTTDDRAAVAGGVSIKKDNT